MNGIFSVSLDRSRWLGIRQERIAENISNVNTPGYKARDVIPFREILSGAAAALQVTHPDHIVTAPVTTSPVRGAQSESGQVLSGNSVDLDAELLKLSENSRNHAMAAGVTRAFHRMHINSVKSA